ncbi:hypothetical protein E4T38_04117 [Aureobasidium subglaciale]|nr:hypothetical protein E4T38_04117 [Aureobasidium subglaciale]KAI5224850.1 hypothetical protein E4T40_03892 [Aureobasidium subglaciale]KAI5227921.1 hypothetical protein E4T41_04112 [Aureobasidium subglaciale]KAI5263462.1 hypothetical protein E4T46_03733 [Aureobasidium subglaciale]
MVSGVRDCPDCRPGQPGGRCPKHKKEYNPSSKRRKRDREAREVAHTIAEERDDANTSRTGQNITLKTTTLNDKSTVERQFQKDIAEKIKKDKALRDRGNDLSEAAGGYSNVKHLDAGDINAIVACILNSSDIKLQITMNPPVSESADVTTKEVASSTTRRSESNASTNPSDAKSGNYSPSWPSFGSDEDCSDSDFGDDPEDGDSGSEVKIVDTSGNDGQGTSENPFDVDDQPGGLSTAQQKALEKREQELNKGIIELFSYVGSSSALGVFAESLLDVEEKFRAQAATEQKSITQTSMLHDILTREIFLYDILALQPSSPLVKGNPSWLNDDLIENMVNLFAEREGLLDGAEYLNPGLTSLVLPSLKTSDVLAQLHAYLSNDEEAAKLFPLGETTTLVVSVLGFPGHWTTFSIDQPSGVVTFVDSLPDEYRRTHASKVLVLFAQLCGRNPTPTKQANLDDCGVFASVNAVALLVGQELPSKQGSEQARILAIDYRWKYLEAIRGLLLGVEGSHNRLDDVLEGRGFVVPNAVAKAIVERAQARIKSLNNATRKEAPENTKKKARKKNETSKAGIQHLGQMINDRRLSKRQKKTISPTTFLPSCVSGVRDLIFRLLSAPENAAGMTVEDMEAPISAMIQRENFAVPETWNILRLLRVMLDRQSHHFQQVDNGTAKWVVTTIPARELSGRYLNELRAKRCSPTPSPLEHPAMLHIFVCRWSDYLSTHQLGKMDSSFEASIKTNNALFGAQKQQPETKPYTQGSLDYPMHIKCALPHVQATNHLREMLDKNQDCVAALQELSDYAQKTNQDDPTFQGQFTYRIIISGLDGGSVNNDSWEDMTKAYPHLRGQLLICNDRGIADPSDPVIVQKPMLDWATPACLLSKAQRKKDIHSHVVWGMFDVAMLAGEWTREDWAPAPRVAGPRHAKIEHDQQLVACRKLLLSNSLMFYHRVDVSIAHARVTSEYADPVSIRAQTSSGNLGAGQKQSVVDRCVPDQEPFARVCRWGSSHEPIHTWALSDKPPQDDESLLGFYCDRSGCYVLEIEECKQPQQATPASPFDFLRSLV